MPRWRWINETLANKFGGPVAVLGHDLRAGRQAPMKIIGSVKEMVYLGDYNPTQVFVPAPRAVFSLPSSQRCFSRALHFFLPSSEFTELSSITPANTCGNRGSFGRTRFNHNRIPRPSSGLAARAFT